MRHIRRGDSEADYHFPVVLASRSISGSRVLPAVAGQPRLALVQRRVPRLQPLQLAARMRQFRLDFLILQVVVAILPRHAVRFQIVAVN